MYVLFAGRNLIDYERLTPCIMDWIKKIFKGSGQKNSEEHYHGDYAEDPQFNAPSGARDVWQEHENEEIDRAIALSLLKGNDESQLEEDEQLARALQESLCFESPPQYENANKICAGCNTEIGHGRFLNCLNAFWHPECFRCHACNLQISDYEFSMSGNYRFHKSCYKERYHPKCDVCSHFIPTNTAGLIEYRAHPFWIQKYCPSHEHDGTPRCCSCERIEVSMMIGSYLI
ncbi:Protein DA1-related 1 [Hibiscus syriacus]|uniref:Protein DA1-related 1 n=1 Tax=Hibiscus syriacus TaxID=106335 RepID=A0A6A2YLI5_HIBSY|nr:Protein DA1-related 1 [Hibiscus syriacus]